MKQIPNILTLLNLFFGCVAIVLILQNGLLPATTAEGDLVLMLPEKMYWASVCIGVAAVIDFLDGLVARMLRISSEMGKQLDSLADVVSFGVAPAMIIYQFLRLSFAQQEYGLEVSSFWLLPAFLVPCAGAFRLARFNLDKEQTLSFKGLPIPAAGLLIASFPLIYWYSNNSFVAGVILNTWFWYLLTGIVSFLMVSTYTMMAFKFSAFNVKKDLPKILLLLIGVVGAIFLQWLAVPLVFVAYVLFSFLIPNT